MFVEIPTLEMLIPFAIFGFILFVAVIWKYSFMFGGWITKKLLDKFFTKKETHVNRSKMRSKGKILCNGKVEYDKSRVLLSNPPQYVGKCKKCGTIVYSLCNKADRELS